MRTKLDELVERIEDAENKDEVNQLLTELRALTAHVNGLVNYLNQFDEWQVTSYGTRDKETQRVVSNQLWSEVKEHAYAIGEVRFESTSSLASIHDAPRSGAAARRGD